VNTSTKKKTDIPSRNQPKNGSLEKALKNKTAQGAAANVEHADLVTA
jgi:hypothetical protein